MKEREREREREKWAAPVKSLCLFCLNHFQQPRVVWAKNLFSSIFPQTLFLSLSHVRACACVRVCVFVCVRDRKREIESRLIEEKNPEK